MLRKLATLGLFVVGVGASLLLVASARSGGSLTPAHHKQTNPGEVISSPTQPIEAEIIVLRPSGFEPKEISRPPGPFFLALHNLSRLDQLDVSLNPESGPSLQAIGVTKNKTRWQQKMTLPPGTYLLREASHPEWVCRITIQP